MTSLNIGIVGAGRTRSGLGPFLATMVEKAGCRVTAVAGRSEERAEETAVTIGEQLGHAVDHCHDAQALCRSGIAALVIASPPEHHLEALGAALSAGLPVLCEKPLVPEQQGEAGAALVSQFVEKGVLLMENCQWPFALPWLRKLYDYAPSGSVHRLALGMMPGKPGRAIVQGTLSHLLSVAQSVATVDPATTVESVSLDKPSLMFTPNVLRCRLVGPRINLALSLHLDLCSAPPRPAWIAIDDIRMDRQIGPDYQLSFVRSGREVVVPDPMEQLVSRFASCVREPRSQCAADEGELIRQRLRLYRDVMGCLS